MQPFVLPQHSKFDFLGDVTSGTFKNVVGDAYMKKGYFKHSTRSIPWGTQYY